VQLYYEHQRLLSSSHVKFTDICQLVLSCSSRSLSIPDYSTDIWKSGSWISGRKEGRKEVFQRIQKSTNLQIFNDRGIVINSLSVHSFSHTFSIESKLLHCLLLCKIRSFVEELPRRLVLESGHVEESGRGADFCGHGYLVSEMLQKSKIIGYYRTVTKRQCLYLQ